MTMLVLFFILISAASSAPIGQDEMVYGTEYEKMPKPYKTLGQVLDKWIVALAEMESRMNPQEKELVQEAKKIVKETKKEDTKIVTKHNFNDKNGYKTYVQSSTVPKYHGAYYFNSYFN